MGNLSDRNANLNKHDYGKPPFHLSALYIVHWADGSGTHLKIGAAERQSKDLAEVLYSVRQRVRQAVPCTGPRRCPQRPQCHVWVILTSCPALRHELEQDLVDAFGDRRFDPLGGRRREFCDPDRFNEVLASIDRWRGQLPNALSESLYSEDGGHSYLAPRVVLPYMGATAGLWVEPEGETWKLDATRRHVPVWRRSASGSPGLHPLERRVDALMRGHTSLRVARLHRGLFMSPALATVKGRGFEVDLGAEASGSAASAEAGSP
jgi:hypothetical protein